jgi:hypothetical protein
MLKHFIRKIEIMLAVKNKFNIVKFIFIDANTDSNFLFYIGLKTYII